MEAQALLEHIRRQPRGRTDFKHLARQLGARGKQRAALQETLETLAAAGVPCGPVLDLDQALAHPQTLAMGFLPAMAVAGLATPAPIARMPLDFSGYAPPHERPPVIGEHTDRVLAEAGYSAAEIADLHARAVV